jgi:pyrroline-5-carboxylate reductase
MTPRKTIGIIGGGNMGTAILGRIKKTHRVCVCEQNPRRADYLRKTYQVRVANFNQLAKEADVILLAIKPQDFPQVLTCLAGIVKTQKLIISIAAGVTTSYIEKKLNPHIKTIRAMPNLPAIIGEGMTAICKGKNAKQRDLEFARGIFNKVGATIIVKEKLMDAVTAVSGSGPAYVFLFIECLTQAARKLGLSPQDVEVLIAQTLKGSLRLFEQQKEPAEVLRGKVTSKGGTTQAAMDVFIKNKIPEIFQKALSAAKKRAGELRKN